MYGMTRYCQPSLSTLKGELKTRCSFHAITLRSRPEMSSHILPSLAPSQKGITEILISEFGDETTETGYSD